MAGLKLTQKQIEGWCGRAVYEDALRRVKRGEVLRADVSAPWIEGRLARSHGELRCRFKVLENGLVDSHCPCRANREHGLVCVHVASLAIGVMQRATDPRREQLYREEQRHARRMEEDGDLFVGRDPEGLPAKLRLGLSAEWALQFEEGQVELACAFAVGDRESILSSEQLDRRRPLRFSPEDDNILCVLEDIAGRAPPRSMKVKRADFLNVLEVCRDRVLPLPGGKSVGLHSQKLAMHLRMDLDRENGELLLFAHTELPFMPPGEFPRYFVEGTRGYVYGAGHLWPVTPILPLPYHGLYREPVVIARSAVIGFLTQELPRLSGQVAIESDLTPDLFSTEPGRPRFKLLLRGSPASLAAELRACYGTVNVAAGAPEVPGAVCEPDPEDLLHYFTRNLPEEEKALSRLRAAGFEGPRGDALEPLTGTREVLNCLGGFVPALRRSGWGVDVEGRAKTFFEQTDMILPVVKVDAPRGAEDWFDVAISYEGPDGTALPQGPIQRAILRGEAFLEHNGRTLLIDREAVAAMRDVFKDCQGRDGNQSGGFKLPSIYAPYVQASLSAMDGVDVECPEDWRLRAARQNREQRIEPESLGSLDGILRPYQKEGVYWLRFLERGGFAGILADEMGLGKTLQTLAWLQRPRAATEAAGQPALIVCPTSLVENWAHESAQFTPELKCLTMSGAGRHEHWKHLAGYDLVITSYALLRRDLDNYLETKFSVAVLDEAQHIKNRDTQNALAAKRIRAVSRLVLTGTPVENSVADLWSIMDFLMPGYLGNYDTFRLGYEQPISQGDREGEEAQIRLRRKLHPFLLRRLKRDVARDLPDKIQKISFSTLTPDQQGIYNQLLGKFRQRIGDLVAQRGFERSRMEILAILMRLRQICCHLELLPRELRGDIPSEAPSAKMEQFFELLDEAIDGGHRMLVFSQFTSMLKLLRTGLEQRGIAHCYLDGETRERMAAVQRFNLQRNIPVFLISLKAGGTGLNLTGADMVVHFDPWWNPAVEDQATDRAHRIGQKRTVYSVKLIAEHTVEEKVLALQQRKQAVIQATVGQGDEAVLKSLNWQDIQELLR